mmetsp:Transcript_21235/g.59808  ORF Transcript_21235/g.59808 Transcript_21235/m.59808 type:complete len:125 (-) Transcript_21235:34-408(-)
MCKGCCYACYHGEAKFPATYCCCGVCSAATWCRWYCSMCTPSNSECWKNALCCPIAFTLLSLWVILTTWSDLWSGIQWLICCGNCGKQCKCFCKTSTIDIEDGCPTCEEYMELAQEIGEDLADV